MKIIFDKFNELEAEIKSIDKSKDVQSNRKKRNRQNVLKINDI